jgi:hypothetical protein
MLELCDMRQMHNASKTLHGNLRAFLTVTIAAAAATWHSRVMDNTLGRRHVDAA